MRLQPAFQPLGMNECPFCKKESLVVIEKEITEFTLSKYGMKEDLNNSDYDVFIQCQECGEKFNATTIGGRWCIAEKTPAPKNHDILSFNPFDKRG